MNIISILVFSIAYYIMAIVVKEDIKKSIARYRENVLFEQGYVNNKIASNLIQQNETIAFFGAIVWPLYYSFLIGTSLGTIVFNMLLNKYEDRIAPWFV